MAGVVILPEKTLKKFYSNILPVWKVCFFAALIVGLLAHIYKLTGWIPNWDSLVFRYDSQNMIGLGRWFLPVICSFTSFYDLPFLNGIIAIIFHALGAVIICKILNVSKKITAVLIGSVIVSFPTVTSIMMYNYVADGYSIAFFLSTLAAMFLTSKKPRYLLSALLIALSTGIYQAYLTVTIMLVLLKLIDEIIYDRTQFIAILKKISFILISGIGGVVLYSVILRIVMSVFSTDLLDYQGINSSFSLSSLDIWGSLYTIKETFKDFFFDFSNGINVHVIINAFALLFTIAHYGKYIVINKIYKSFWNIFAVIVFCAMLIIGAGVLSFINPGIDYHTLMLMGYAVFYLFFIILYERGTDVTKKHSYIKQWIILITAIVLVANQVVVANVSYHKAQIAYEKSYGTLIRIADRIEQSPDSKNCKKIVIFGALENSEDYSVNLSPNITGITDGYILRADDETVGQSVLCSALNDYCDMNYEFLYGVEKEKFAQKDEVKAMGEWPATNSIAVIDNTVVVKLNVEGEK
ncbi:MAG: hypothetical protein E7565_03230 [Ruminococcaceae bacterium]|nr:hypothetical protein [Oscillospiraceae bacterium]